MGVHSRVQSVVPQQVAKNKEAMLELAKKFCSNSGGYGMVSDRYVFIDLTKYDVVLKED